MGILPRDHVDRPDEEDPEVQRIAASLGLDPTFLANTAEEVMVSVFRRTGERAPVEDVLAALEATIAEAIAKR
jgi:hypothetical protein